MITQDQPIIHQAPLSLVAFEEFIQNLPKARILVIGDVMLDRYWSGSAHRISPEAPVPIVHIKNNEDRLGGAANVAKNIKSMSAAVTLLAAVGDDMTATHIQAYCQEAGITHLFSTFSGASTLKLRVLAQNQQMIRLDFEQPVPSDNHIKLKNIFDQQLEAHDLIVLSDYQKGVLNDNQTLQYYINQAKSRGKKVLIDPKGNDFERYQGAYLLTPNRKEFETIVGICNNEDTFQSKAFDLCHKLQLGALLVTRSEEGMSLFYQNQCHHYPTKAKEVFDVSGAGDTVLAILAVFLAAGLDLIKAVYYANLAAGLAVAKLGTSSINVSEIQQAQH